MGPSGVVAVNTAGGFFGFVLERAIFVGPGEESSEEVGDVFEAGSLEFFSDFFAAVTDGAIDDDGSRFVDFGKARDFEIIVANPLSIREVADVEFFLIAGVEQD